MRILHDVCWTVGQGRLVSDSLQGIRLPLRGQTPVLMKLRLNLEILRNPLPLRGGPKSLDLLHNIRNQQLLPAPRVLEHLMKPLLNIEILRNPLVVRLMMKLTYLVVWSLVLLRLEHLSQVHHEVPSSSSAPLDPRCSVPGCNLPGGHRLPHVYAGGNKFMYDKRTEAMIPIEASDAETSVVADSTDSEMLPDEEYREPEQKGRKDRKRKEPAAPEDMTGYMFEINMTGTGSSLLANHGNRQLGCQRSCSKRVVR